jgi:hypothetical protein
MTLTDPRHYSRQIHDPLDAQVRERLGRGRAAVAVANDDDLFALGKKRFRDGADVRRVVLQGCRLEASALLRG